MPATVISRTQRFDFRRIDEAVIAAKLERICAAEGVGADAGALAPVARLADGGMRDAESLLDQVLAFTSGSLTADDVREAVGLADDATIVALVDAYLGGDAPSALDHIAQLADVGRDMGQVAAQAEGEARRRLLASAADPVAARRLAAILRTLGEAAGIGAREGRARLLLELLSVDGMPAVATPAVAAPARPTAAGERPRLSVVPDRPAAADAPAPKPAAVKPAPAARAASAEAEPIAEPAAKAPEKPAPKAADVRSIPVMPWVPTSPTSAPAGPMWSHARRPSSSHFSANAGRSRATARG